MASIFLSTLVTFLYLVRFVVCGNGGFVTLINSTPYNWVLASNHSYQMDWHPKEFIEAG
jgi:hypothetical protein